MLRKRLPSNVSLFAFEASARNRSFTKAAAELNVTQPAISTAVGNLERFLATRLFERAGAKVELTKAGMQLYRAVGAGFRSIEAAISDIRGKSDREEPISLSISTAMTAHWLVPQLPELYRRFPRVELHFTLAPGDPKGPIDEFDLAIRLDSLLEGNVDALPFLEERIYAVCSPAYLTRNGPLGAGREHILISSFGRQRVSWNEFLEHVEGHADAGVNSLTFSDYAIVIQAAVSGQGIAMGWISVVSHLLATGIIVKAHPVPFITGRRYFLAMPKSRADRSVTREVRQWIADRMAKDIEAIESNVEL